MMISKRDLFNLRYFWSTRDPTKIVRYTCRTRVVSCEPGPDEEILSDASHVVIDHESSKKEMVEAKMSEFASKCRLIELRRALGVPIALIWDRLAAHIGEPVAAWLTRNRHRVQQSLRRDYCARNAAGQMLGHFCRSCNSAALSALSSPGFM